MAFCTTCGASVAGAFCAQCGTPVSAASGQAAPIGAPVPQPAPAAAPVKRKTSPIVWVLIVIVGLLVVGGIATVATGFFVFHKVRQAGVDPDLMKRNPGYAIAKMFVAANPNIEEVDHDEAAGTITFRDRNTGKVTTMNFDEIKSGKVKVTAESENGGTATMEFGTSGKLPSWVPAYPGAGVQGTFSVKGDSGDGTGEGGSFTFTTSDSPSKVMSFYQDRARDMGMKVGLATTTNEGGMLMITDDDEKRSLTVVVGKSDSSGETSVNITYGQKQ